MIKKSVNCPGASLSTKTICVGFSFPNMMATSLLFAKIVFMLLLALNLIEKELLFIFPSIDLLCKIRFLELLALSVKAYCFVLSYPLYMMSV